MSGILDNKSRIIDAILTIEGRRQMANGDFAIKFATYSDSSVYYQKDVINGHADPTNRVYLECFNLPQDQIIFEADDSGNLIPFRQHEFIGLRTITGNITGSSSWINFYNGKLKENTKNYGLNYAVTSSYSETQLADANFASQIEGLLTSSIDNFAKLKIIGTKDRLFEDQEFAISNNQITFEIESNMETVTMQSATSINSIDSLFNDEKLRNVENFKYLPPIKKSNDIAVDKTNVAILQNANLLLGNYPPWGPIDPLTYADIKEELDKYESTSKTVYFDPTSKDNEVIAQMFEITNDKLTKLDVIDYGKVSNNSSNPQFDLHHVFFIGKVLVDDTGSTNFIHLFTLVFESLEENNVID